MGGRAVVSDDEDELHEEEDGREEEKEGGGRDGRDDDDEEEDEEEEGQDEYEKDGFIVDDVDEEEEEEDENKEDSDEERHRKKKRKRRESEKNYVLDEDDYELLQDNNVSVPRPKQFQGPKFKRLKKAGRGEQGERSGFSDEEESDDRNSRGGHRTAEEKLKRSLFGDDEGVPLEDIAEEEEQMEEEEDADIIGDDDEMADFIVDEEDVDEHGVAVKKKKGKKKKVRQAHGVSSHALEEAQEIFGDVDELLMLRRQSNANDAANFGEKRLEDEFEPLIISEKYMTQKDDVIRETDVPERIQLSEEVTGSPPTDDVSIEEESSWIKEQLIKGGVPPQVADKHVLNEVERDDIGRVLTMIHVQKLDLPFIAMYRKELCLSLLKDTEDLPGDENTPRITWHKLLWAVYNLDRKWLLLQKRKSNLQMYYNKRFDEEARRIDDETRLELNRQLFDSISKALKSASSEREVDDIDAKFNLHFPPGEVETDEGQFKRPQRKSLYNICYKAGLWEVANKFGYSSERLGDNIIKEKVLSLEELENPIETPEEVAANFTCAMFETPADVLKGARHMAAAEIGCEPSVKKHVRNVFMEKAVVSTSPTAAGNSVIDVHHELAGVKWLRNKPLSEFVDAQWLRIQKAEKEKLLQVTVKLPEGAQAFLLNDAKENYLSDGVSKSAQNWNEQREKILEDAFSNFILPSMEKEARALLTARAKNWLLMEYGRHFWSKVSVAPYQQKEANNDEDDSELRVMACCWGPGKPATTFVMLDSAGEIVDILYAGSISVRSQGVAEKQRKQLDQQRLLKFLTDHEPSVVCLGTANMSCRALKDDIYEVIFDIVEDHPRETTQDMRAGVIFGDESLPRLYENARISLDQLPSQPGIVRRAVGLGRYLQNPLAMVATLCGPGKEILSWKFFHQDHFLSDDEKFDMIEQIMVDATNQVGLDINLAASHEWLFAPLQFISGLGPRKASALQRAFVRAGSILNRKEIPVGKIVRKKVFINAAGFLRVRRSGAAAVSNHIMDLLDDTRIHPESYDLAKKLAKDVREEECPEEVDDDEELAIEFVRDKPEMLNSLDIDAYHNSYFGAHGTRKLETFHLIKMELLHGFQDCRVPFVEFGPDEEFSMLSGETDDSLFEGRHVQVRVRQVQETRVMCIFDSGLKGFIMPEDFADDGYEPDKIQEGEVITCKIKNVNKQRYIVYLTSKGSELSKKPRFIHNLDPFYEEDDINLHSAQEKARKEKELAKKHFKPRMIVHPRFQNLTADEAMQYLADKEAGESIIRPSSKGPSFLTLTLKIYEDVYAHKDVVESGKDHKDITSLLRLGKSLTIDKETFEDLDEVMDRYVDPLVNHLKNMLSYRKFKKGRKAEIDDMLKAEKAENPMRIVYCFGISHEHPGTFILAYIRSSTPHHEYVGLYPKGFRFRKRDFEDIDRMVNYFQNNVNKPPPDAGPSLRTVAAMVPMKSPAPWGSSGEGSVDREQSSTPGSRSGGRSDYRGGRGGRGGRGRGRGRDSDFRPRNEDDGGLSSFPGAKVQNSPGREMFPGGWGNEGSGSGGGGGAWSTGNDNNNNNNNDTGDGGRGSGGWGSDGGGGRGSGGWGSDGGGRGSGGWRSDGGGGGRGSSGWSDGGGRGRGSSGWSDGGEGGGGRASGGWSSGGGARGSGRWGGDGGRGGRGSGGRGGGGGGRWGGDPSGTSSRGSDGNSEWGGGSKRLVPQSGGGGGWSAGGGSGGGGGGW